MFSFLVGSPTWENICKQTNQYKLRYYFYNYLCKMLFAIVHNPFKNRLFAHCFKCFVNMNLFVYCLLKCCKQRCCVTSYISFMLPIETLCGSSCLCIWCHEISLGCWFQIICFEFILLLISSSCLTR